MLKIKILTIICFLTINALSFANEDAKVDKYMQEQRLACSKNTAMEWSASLNRCVGKQEARESRNEANECSKIQEVSAREKCHLALAEKKTSLSADPKSLNQGNTSGSMVLNGVAAAYTIIGYISAKGKGGQGSGCTSKSILGITSIAGLASDIFLKMKAKKKVKELEGKYKLDVKSNALDAQVKAFEYLKEEQQTVAEIAGMEKKRNLALMIGYGLAAGFAAYELTPMGQNPKCYKPEDPKNEAGASENLAADQNTTSLTATASAPPPNLPTSSPSIK